MADRIVDVKTHAHLMPGRLFDANGQEVRRVVWSNLDTGECRAVAASPDGNILRTSHGHAVINTEFRPAPLTFVSLKGK